MSIEMDSALEARAEVAQTRRDHFLDLIRTISTGRVVLWHTFGVPFISYLVAAMPAMFFVFGSLLEASARRRKTTTVVWSRLKRVLIPLWLFSAVVWGGAAIFTSSVNFDSIGPALLWFFPIDDPTPTTWDGGWLSSPLWFMRTMFWILVTAPLWLKALRRMPLLTLATSVGLVFAFDIAARQEALVPENYPLLWWKLGDQALYGFFAMAGAATTNASSVLAAIRVRWWLVLAAVSAGAATAWILTQDVHLNVVNNSHPMHLFVGTAWLAVALAARPALTAFAERPGVLGIVKAVNKRALTIYLWHTTAIAGVVWALGRVDIAFGAAEPILRIVFVVIGIAALTAMFGWMEDVAAGRRPSVQGTLSKAKHSSPRQRGAVVLATAAAVSLVFTATLSPASSQARSAPPIPSQQPPAPEFVTEDELEQIDMSPLTQAEANALIADRVKEWRARDHARGGAVVATNIEGLRFQANDGLRNESDEPIQVDDKFDMASTTKLLTASVVFNLAEEGLIDLDAPLPGLWKVPEFPYSSQITPRMLLTHRSGLLNYRDTEIYKDDIYQVATPEAAVRASISQPLMNVPGEEVHYSSTNFIVLGFLIEQITGEPWDDVLQQQVLGPLGMKNTSSLPSAPGEPRGATAGTLTTLDDLAIAVRSILHDRSLIAEPAYEQMITIDPGSALGAGAIGFCPCIDNGDGTKSYTSFGHYGGDSISVHFPDSGVVVAFHSAENIHEERHAGVIDLVNDVANIASRAIPDPAIV